MKGKNRQLFVVTVLALSLVLAGSLPAFAQAEEASAFSEVSVESTKIVWQPLIGYGGAVLTVVGLDGKAMTYEFAADRRPALNFVDATGNVLADGLYKYELTFLRPDQLAPPADFDAEDRGVVAWEGTKEALVQSGSFSVLDGAFVTPEVEEGETTIRPRAAAPEDQQILDDLIVDGSICAGLDCVNGESFGFDTIRLKENNLRIRFYDTSSSASFPSNDWQITANDSSNGGQNKFSIDDIDGGRTPFTIEASAPSHSLYVDDGGRIGLGTSTPVTDIHDKNGNTPTLRLEQDGTSGFTPQTWDVAGNEANFFIRDATNGSTLPFRIFPGAPSDALNVASSGNIGLGTTSPAWPLEIERSGSNPLVFLERTDTSAQFFFGVSTKGQLGTLSSHDVDLMAGGANRMTLLSSPEATTSANVIVPGTQHINGDLWVDGTIHGTVGSQQSSATIEELQAQVAELKARVAALESDNAALLGLLGELDKRLADLEAMSGEEPVRRLEQ